MRKADFGSLVLSLRSELNNEHGPELKRPAGVAWISWVHAVPGKRVRGTPGARHASGAQARAARHAALEGAVAAAGGSMLGSMLGGESEEVTDIMPLHLVDVMDAEYMETLYAMLHKGALPIRSYLHNIVLPDNTAHQASKLSANGQVGPAPEFSFHCFHSNSAASLPTCPVYLSAGPRRRDALWQTNRLLRHAFLAAAARDGRVCLPAGRRRPHAPGAHRPGDGLA
jgi:hypothetical protein